jgi:hypothetical protein
MIAKAPSPALVIGQLKVDRFVHKRINRTDRVADSADLARG